MQGLFASARNIDTYLSIFLFSFYLHLRQHVSVSSLRPHAYIWQCDIVLRPIHIGNLCDLLRTRQLRKITVLQLCHERYRILQCRGTHGHKLVQIFYGLNSLSLEDNYRFQESTVILVALQCQVIGFEIEFVLLLVRDPHVRVIHFLFTRIYNKQRYIRLHESTDLFSAYSNAALHVARANYVTQPHLTERSLHKDLFFFAALVPAVQRKRTDSKCSLV